MGAADFSGHALLYIPIGIIGFWRWGVWLFKKICASFYRPIPEENHPSIDMTLSVITPVYMEEPEIFRKALNSWQANNPNEIIAVIDEIDEACRGVFLDFAAGRPWAKLVVTSKPGKRAALADGIREATSEIVALVDSDAIWAHDIRGKVLAPFSDSQIGGVVTRQNCLNPHSIWQKITDIMWDLRNADEWPSQTAMGRALSCVSGRTAIYRRDILLPRLDEFQNEILLGRKKESGDDKCLTRLIQKDGWKTYYQSTAQIYSTATSSFNTFWKQRVRWSRNSYGSDITALFVERWVWKHPYLTFFMIDRFISPFTLLFALIVFIVALSLNQWVAALGIFAWWTLSRGVKTFPHLRRRPRDTLLVPVYAAVSFIIAAARVYSLITVRQQKWIRDRVE